MRRSGLVFGGLALALSGAAAGIGAQEADVWARAGQRLTGCYELRFEPALEWLNDIEHRIRLSVAPLDSQWAMSRRFVVRAAPGQPASWYPLISWSVDNGVSPLEIVWEWTGYDWIIARFEIEPEWRGGEVWGTIERGSDAVGEEYPPGEVSIKRADCIIS